MLLVLVLKGVCRGLVGRPVCELFIIILGTQLAVIRIAKGGHVDLTI
jgi:hypothetical protein